MSIEYIDIELYLQVLNGHNLARRHECATDFGIECLRHWYHGAQAGQRLLRQTMTPESCKKIFITQLGTVEVVSYRLIYDLPDRVES